MMSMTALVSMGLALCCGHAWAQLSARDGYAPDGASRLQVEITPYLWLPATNTRFDLGANGSISRSGGTGVPSAAQLANSLHGAFMGYGLMRYGPWSGELDIDWVSASVGKTTAPGPLGNTEHKRQHRLEDNTGYAASASARSKCSVRPAHGSGVQVLNKRRPSV